MLHSEVTCSIPILLSHLHYQNCLITSASFERYFCSLSKALPPINGSDIYIYIYIYIYVTSSYFSQRGIVYRCEKSLGHYYNLFSLCRKLCLAATVANGTIIFHKQTSDVSIFVLCEVTPYSMIECSRRFGGARCFYLKFKI
jgi:hypothetical protein